MARALLDLPDIGVPSDTQGRMVHGVDSGTLDVPKIMDDRSSCQGGLQGTLQSDLAIPLEPP